MRATDPSAPAPFPFETSPPILSRRGWLWTTGGILAAGASALAPNRVAGGGADDAELIVRNRRPIDLETPVTALGGLRTPNASFFVRTHLGEPAVGLFPWKVEVRGLVEHPLSIAPESLADFETVTLDAVLQCSGNGRAFFLPKLPGVQWERGAVGNASWKGVRLADVLKRAKLRKGAAHVHFLGADTPPSPKTPAFLRSLPLARALDPGTILATEMNGEPLPVLHGGPVRLVVPGWSGNHWMKWLRTVTVSAEEAPGFYQQTGYRIPKSSAPPDAVLKPGDLVPITTMNVKSLITSPGEGACVPGARLEIRGVAWTGEGHVTKVEVSTDRDPTWRAADLLGEPRGHGWRPWRFALDARPGRTTLRARATDSNGETQPETTPWNKSGYLWNGIDRVSVEVA